MKDSRYESEGNDPIYCAAEDYSNTAKGEYFLDEDYKYVEKFSREDLQEAFLAGEKAALVQSGKERNVNEAFQFFDHGHISGIRWSLWMQRVYGPIYQPPFFEPSKPLNMQSVFLQLIDNPGEQIRWTQEYARKSEHLSLKEMKIEVGRLNFLRKLEARSGVSR